MAWTILSGSILLTQVWQKIELEDFDLIRIKTLTEPEYTNNISKAGRFEIAQFDAENNCFSLKAIRWEGFPVIYNVPKPVFFDTQLLGIRLAPDFAPFTVKIEAQEMSVTTTSDKGSIATIATTKGYAAMPSPVTPYKAIAQNPKRKGLVIPNPHSSNLIIGFSNTVSATGGRNFAVVPPSETYEANVGYTGDIWFQVSAGQLPAGEFVELESA